MLKQLLVYGFLLVAIAARGQGNLVYHTSFEIDPINYCSHSSINAPFQSTRLENFYDDIFTVLNSVDIFSPCDTFTVNGNPYQYSNNIPLNIGGFQYCFAGVNYIGLVVGGDTVNLPSGKYYREWVGINPNYDFIKNKFYKVVFYISVGDTSGVYSMPPQVYFSADSIYYESGGTADFTTINYNKVSTIDTSVIYRDTVNWMPITETFKSNGEEKYLYLGNFFDYKHTKFEYTNDYVPLFSKPFSYFYIDDLSVYELDSVVNVPETPAPAITIYPNPATNSVSIDIPINYTNQQLYIYNLTGQLVATKPVQPNQPVPIAELNAGIYIFAVQSNNTLIGREKVVVY